MREKQEVSDYYCRFTRRGNCRCVVCGEPIWGEIDAEGAPEEDKNRSALTHAVTVAYKLHYGNSHHLHNTKITEEQVENILFPKKGTIQIVNIELGEVDEGYEQPKKLTLLDMLRLNEQQSEKTDDDSE